MIKSQFAGSVERLRSIAVRKSQIKITHTHTQAHKNRKQTKIFNWIDYCDWSASSQAEKLSDFSAKLIKSKWNENWKENECVMRASKWTLQHTYIATVLMSSRLVIWYLKKAKRKLYTNKMNTAEERAYNIRSNHTYSDVRVHTV